MPENDKSSIGVPMEIGCCGAHCKPCKALKEGICLGCKIGYDNGARDIDKSKCKIKLCCFKDHGYMTCADCDKLGSCETIQGFYAKGAYKYKKYRQAVEYIKIFGYDKFLEMSKDWKNAYGKY